MIKYIKYENLDAEKWDQCIKGAVNSLPYAFSWYLDVVCSHWDALVLNDYEAVFPLPFKQKLGISYLYTPFWVQQLGLFSRTCEALESSNDFINAIPTHFRYVDLNMNNPAPIGEIKGVHLKENVNYILDLSKDYESLYSGYSTNNKRNIKKALKQGLTLFKNDSPKELIRMFRSNRGKDLGHLKGEQYQSLELLMHAALHRHCGQLWMAYGEGNRALSGMFLLFAAKRVILLFTGNTIEGKEKGAMSFLINSFIKEAANTGLAFDFEGSNDADLARFYKGFGAENHSYQNLEINRLPLILRMLK